MRSLGARLAALEAQALLRPARCPDTWHHRPPLVDRQLWDLALALDEAAYAQAAATVEPLRDVCPRCGEERAAIAIVPADDWRVL
jgi:hypothetical protein